MKLAVSNIAWDPADNAKAYRLLQQHGVRGLEVAPRALLPDATDVFDPEPTVVANALSLVREHELELVSMQSLLFGVEGAALFGTIAEREQFRRAMLRAIRLAEVLQIPNLVFGSPRQRNVPDGTSLADAVDRATRVFQELGDAAAKSGTVIAMEPNPTVYGTNFLNTMADAVAFVARVNHPAVKLNLDLGAILLNDESAHVETTVQETMPHISHVHISEPRLAPPAARAVIARLCAALEENHYARWCSIEMQRHPTDAMGSLAHSIRLVQEAAATRSRHTSAQ